jgi:carboxymethylenebutenolidase
MSHSVREKQTYETSTITVTVSDGTFSAYIARPTSVPKVPVVVVLQEIFGVNKDLRETCNELAERGFIALSPDLFWRDAPGLDLNAWSESDWARGFELYGTYDFDRGVKDIEATITASRLLAGASGRVGVMGFCLGGLMTFLTAARTNVDAAVAYYGGGTDKHLAEAKSISAPLLMHLAGEDEFIPPEARGLVILALAANPNAEIHVYEGQNHAFARHTGAHYDEASTILANARTYEFLERALKS